MIASHFDDLDFQFTWILIIGRTFGAKVDSWNALRCDELLLLLLLLQVSAIAQAGEYAWLQKQQQQLGQHKNDKVQQQQHMKLNKLQQQQLV